MASGAPWCFPEATNCVSSTEDALLNLGCNAIKAFTGNIGNQQDKLLTTQPEQAIRWAAGRVDQLHETHQHIIADSSTIQPATRKRIIRV